MNGSSFLEFHCFKRKRVDGHEKIKSTFFDKYNNYIN